MPPVERPEEKTFAGSLSPDVTRSDEPTAPVEQTMISESASIDALTLAGTLVPADLDENPTVGADDFSITAGPTTLSPELNRNRYLVHEEIARGGMGAILRGHDGNLRRELALKVLLEAHLNKPAVVNRFVEEAQISGRLQHPGIVPVYDLGVLPDQRPYFSMKLVHGKTFSALLTERNSATDDQAKCLGIFEQICQTVAYAHNQGVIHRDLKSANIMVGEFGEVQVMDWGLAKVLGASADQVQARFDESPLDVPENGDQTRFDGGSAPFDGFGSHTLAGSVLGTPAYMPPEQARGELDRVDERADVFGLGAILCEILTGSPPYVGATGVEILKQATRGDLEPCFQRLTACGADPDLIALARHCLAQEPADRPRHAGVVSQQITGFLESVQHRLQAAEVERAAESARAAEALHTVAETQAKARAERRARQLQLAMAAVVAVLLGIGGIAASLVAVQQNRLKDNALLAEKKAVLAREAESMAKQGAEAEKARAESEKKRADLTLADMLTSRGLLAAERMDAAQAALWFAHASTQAAEAADSGRAHENRLRAQNWLREAVVPVGSLSFADAPTALSFQPFGDLLLIRGAGLTGVWNWKEDALLPIPVLKERVTAACWSPNGAQLAIAHVGTADSYVGLGMLYNATDGVLRITGIVPGSGAADSGLEPGDLLEKLDGNPVNNQEEIGRLLRGKGANDTVTVTATRNGESREYPMVLKRLPIPEGVRKDANAVSRVTIWSLPEAKLLEEISTTHPVGALAFSPDERFLAVGEQEVGLWDLDRREFLKRRWPHPQGVSSLVFNRVGDRLVTTCDDKQVRVFAAPGAEDQPIPLFAPIPHAPLIASPPALTEDDQTLLTITGNNQVGPWSMTDGKPVHGGQFGVLPSSLTRIVASRDQQWFVTGGNYGPEIRSAAKPKVEGAHLGHTNLVRDFAFDPQGALLATVSWDQTARFWSVPDGKPVESSLPHMASAEVIAWSSDGSLVATSQGDGLVRIWRRPTNAVVIATVTGSGRRPRLSPDGSLVAPGTWHEAPWSLQSLGISQFQLRRSTDGTPAGMPIVLGGNLFDSCVCTDNQSVAAVYVEGAVGRLGVWEIATGKTRFPPVELPGPGISVAARPGSTQIAVICATGGGAVVDGQTGRVAFDFRHEGWVFGTELCVVRVDYSPDGGSLVSLGDGFPNTIEVRDAETGRLRFPPITPGREFMGRVRSFAFSPDSRFVATAVNGRNFAQVWDLTTGAACSEPLPHPGDFYGLFSLCFNPAGDRLLTGSKDGEARYWDWQSGKLACPPLSNGDEVNGLAITSDGRRAVTASRGKTHPVQFWDLTTGKRIAPTVNVQAPPTDFLSSVVMTPDGRRALTSAQSSALAVIDLEALFFPSPTPLESVKRQAELACGAQIELGDVSRLDREQWQRRWNELPPPERQRLISEFDSRPRATQTLDPQAGDRADRYCREGRWRLAAAAALSQIESEHSFRTQWSRAAACLVLASDRSGYQKLCGDMIKRFGKTNSIEEADSTCKTCLLLPDCAAIDALPATLLAEGLEHPPVNGAFAAWGFGTLGLTRYRRGEWDPCAAACLKSLEFNNRGGMSGALSLLVLSMAEHQREHADEARKLLFEATNLIPTELATLGTGAFQGALPVSVDLVHHDWLMAEILRREASRLILGSTERPLDETTLRQRVEDLIAAQDSDALRRLLIDSIEVHPGRAWTHTLLAMLYGELGEFDMANDALHKAIELEPNAASHRASLGMLLFRQQKNTEALAELHRAIELDPNSEIANDFLGRILMLSGQFGEAATSFERALQSDPQNGTLSQQRADALRLVQLQSRLPQYLSGELAPTDNSERLDVIRLCIALRHHVAAVRFTTEAFAADAELADNPTNGLRYNGACSAARAVAMQEPADKLDETERTRLVRQAIDWLEAERLRFAELLKTASPEERRQLVSMLQHWPRDTDTAGLRDAELVSQFPEELQDRLTTHWAEVQALLTAEQ